MTKKDVEEMRTEARRPHQSTSGMNQEEFHG